MEYTTTINTIDNLLGSARLKYENKDYQGALTDYSTAIDLNPEDAFIYACRGVVQYRMKNVGMALADYDRAICLDPKLGIAYYRRGYIHYLNQKYLSAIADYNKVIQLNPNDAQAHYNRSQAYRELYGEKEALIDLRRAAILFKVQGNLDKHQKMMKLIDATSDHDTWSSGML